MIDPVTPLTPQQEASDFAGVTRYPYWLRVLIEFDVFCNVVFLLGIPGETISSHAARAALKGKWWGLVLSKFLCWFQRDHGAHAEATDDARAEVVVQTEESTGMLPKE